MLDVSGKSWFIVEYERSTVSGFIVETERVQAVSELAARNIVIRLFRNQFVFVHSVERVSS